MRHDIFMKFDNACMAGDLLGLRAVLAGNRASQGQLNAALRHAAYYTGPDTDTREDVIDELIEHGAVVDWDDRGIETVVNAIRPKSPYLLKRVLNACDGNEARLGSALNTIRGKDDADWATRVVEARMVGICHIGL